MTAQQSTMSWSLLAATALVVVILTGRTQAVSLLDLLKPVKGDEGIRLDSREAVDFLRTPSGRLRRHIKWYRQNPDFQAWYKYYQKIGHDEGLYEIDRIRLTYLHMRHLESVYGKDAPYYQYTIGMAPVPDKTKTLCDPKKDGSCKPQPVAPKVPVAQLTPPPPKAQYQAPLQLSCNPHDPACLLQYFYYFVGKLQSDCDPKTDPKCSRGTRTVPCDPKYDPACVPSASAPYKPMEHECNPMYDPDCEEEDDNREDERYNPTHYEDHEDDDESEAYDDETDPYDSRYHGYNGDPSSYYNNPHGASPNTYPYNFPNPNPYNPPNPNPYNPLNPNPYGSPNPSPYDSANAYDSPYGSPYNSPYGSPYNSPYGPPYNSLYGSRYGPQYSQEDEDEDEDDEY